MLPVQSVRRVAGSYPAAKSAQAWHFAEGSAPRALKPGNGAVNNPRRPFKIPAVTLVGLLLVLMARVRCRLGKIHVTCRTAADHCRSVAAT